MNVFAAAYQQSSLSLFLFVNPSHLCICKAFEFCDNLLDISAAPRAEALLTSVSRGDCRPHK